MTARLFARIRALRDTTRSTWTESGMLTLRTVAEARAKSWPASENVVWRNCHRTSPQATHAT
jgi:hypothetical protein